MPRQHHGVQVWSALCCEPVGLLWLRDRSRVMLGISWREFTHSTEEQVFGSRGGVS